MGQERRHFSSEFKNLVVSMSQKTSVREAADHYGVHDTMVYRWRHQFGAAKKQNVSKPKANGELTAEHVLELHEFINDVGGRRQFDQLLESYDEITA